MSYIDFISSCTYEFLVKSEPRTDSEDRLFRYHDSFHLKRRGEGGGAGGNSMSKITGPSDKLFKEILDRLDESKACFKWLREGEFLSELPSSKWNVSAIAPLSLPEEGSRFQQQIQQWAMQ